MVVVDVFSDVVPTAVTAVATVVVPAAAAAASTVLLMMMLLLLLLVHLMVSPHKYSILMIIPGGDFPRLVPPLQIPHTVSSDRPDMSSLAKASFTNS